MLVSTDSSQHNCWDVRNRIMKCCFEVNYLKLRSVSFHKVQEFRAFLRILTQVRYVVHKCAVLMLYQLL